MTITSWQGSHPISARQRPTSNRRRLRRQSCCNLSSMRNTPAATQEDPHAEPCHKTTADARTAHQRCQHTAAAPAVETVMRIALPMSGYVLCNEVHQLLPISSICAVAAHALLDFHSWCSADQSLLGHRMAHQCSALMVAEGFMTSNAIRTFSNSRSNPKTVSVTMRQFQWLKIA